MALFRITDVQRSPDADDRLWGAHLDLPAIGGYYSTFDLRIAGWAVGRTAPIERILIEHDGKVLAHTIMNVYRPDVDAIFPQAYGQTAAGFDFSISIFALPTPFTLTLTAVGTNDERIPLSTIEGIQPSRAPLHTPELYTFAAALGEGYECTHVIALGIDDPAQLAALRSKMRVIGIDAEPRVSAYCAAYPTPEWLAWDFEGAPPAIPRERLRRSIILCVLPMTNPEKMTAILNTLRAWMDVAPGAIVALPASEDAGESTKGEILERLRVQLEGVGLSADVMGFTIDDETAQTRTTAVAVLGNHHRPALIRAPETFRVVAYVAVYNERDVLQGCLEHLLANGLQPYVIDNWSDDGSYELAQQYAARGVHVERFPEVPRIPHQYALHPLMRRIEDLSGASGADWCLIHDADEIHETPFHNVRLLDYFYWLDQQGFNTVNHSLIEFPPTDDHFPDDNGALRTYFTHFKWTTHRYLYRDWKRFGQPMTLVEHTTHIAFTEGRKTAPYRSLMRHYPVRSQRHGARKIIRERLSRLDPGEKALGINRHYADLAVKPFLQDPANLILFHETFYQTYLFERLTGIGTYRKTDMPTWVIQVQSIRRGEV